VARAKGRSRSAAFPAPIRYASAMRCYLLSMAAFAFAAFVTVPACAGDWCPVPIDRAQARLEAHPLTLPFRNAAPNPLPHVHTEGTLPHMGIRDRSIEAERDWPVMLHAALNWRAGVNEKSFGTAHRFLIGWVDTYQPNLNPIDETNLDTMIDTYAILAERLEPDERQRISAWLDKWGWNYVGSIEHAPKSGGTWTNNWQSHRIKLVTMIAAATDDDKMFAEARSLFRRQVKLNLLPDWQVMDFAERDALHYVVYDLEPLLRAALAAKAYRDEDWYHWQAASHASIAKSVAWLTPYATGEKEHQEFVHSRVAFDAQRAAAGVKGFTGAFDVRDAAITYWSAALFDPPAFVALCGN
jgi:hypothetical protein